MRVLACGSRDYTDRDKIFAVLDTLGPTILIEGRARGTDMIAGSWADLNLPPKSHLKFPADWNRYRRGAGPIRNRQMLEEGKPNLVVAFGGLNGTGTNHMVLIVKKAGIPVLEIDRD